MSLLSKKFLDNPQNYLYIFTSPEYRARLGKTAAETLLTKGYYQEKVIVNAVGSSNFAAARDEIREAMIRLYGMTPADALIALAKGETVAGKNFAEGVYGIGKVNTFQGTVGKTVTVDPSTGAISVDGSVVSTNAGAIIGSNKKHNNIIGYTYTDADGTTYTSSYSKLTGKYYCGTRTNSSGTVYKANGSEGSQADMSSIWAGVISDSLDFTQNMLEKLLNNYLQPGEKVLNEKEVLPKQNDAFVYTPQETTSSAGVSPWLLGGVAVAALLAPSFMDMRSGKKK